MLRLLKSLSEATDMPIETMPIAQVFYGCLTSNIENIVESTFRFQLIQKCYQYVVEKMLSIRC